MRFRECLWTALHYNLPLVLLPAQHLLEGCPRPDALIEDGEVGPHSLCNGICVLHPHLPLKYLCHLGSKLCPGPADTAGAGTDLRIQITSNLGSLYDIMIPTQSDVCYTDLPPAQPAAHPPLVTQLLLEIVQHLLQPPQHLASNNTELRLV